MCLPTSSVITPRLWPNTSRKFFMQIRVVICVCAGSIDWADTQVCPYGLRMAGANRHVGVHLCVEAVKSLGLTN